MRYKEIYSLFFQRTVCMSLSLQLQNLYFSWSWTWVCKWLTALLVLSKCALASQSGVRACVHNITLQSPLYKQPQQHLLLKALNGDTGWSGISIQPVGVQIAPSLLSAQNVGVNINPVGLSSSQVLSNTQEVYSGDGATSGNGTAGNGSGGNNR